MEFSERTGEGIFYSLVQQFFAAFALGLIVDRRYELLRFSLRFGLRHFHRISNISAAVATLRKGERLSSRRCLVATQFLHRLLHLLERTHLDLTDALARDAKLGSEILECERVVGEPARLEDTPLALVEHVERRGERLAAVVVFVTRGERSLLAVTFINHPVLPFAGIAVPADRRVGGSVAAETAVHVDHILLGHAEALGDDLHLIGAQIAFLERRDLALRFAQVEEELLLVRRGAHLHQRPRAQDVCLYRCLDPPHGVGCETEALFGPEALDRLHQADIALRDDLGNRQAVPAIAPGDFTDEGEMAGDGFVRRLVVAVLTPAARQHVFFLRFQHREPPDLPKVTGEVGSGRHAPVSGRQPTHDLHHCWRRRLRTSFETKLSAASPIVNLISKRYYLPRGDNASTQNGRAPVAGGTARAS